MGDQLILATGGYDHTIKVWQPHTGNCIKTMRFVETSVSCGAAFLLALSLFSGNPSFEQKLIKISLASKCVGQNPG